MKISPSVKEKTKKFKSMLVGLDSLSNIGYKIDGSKHILSQGPAGESYEFLFSGNNGVAVEFTFYPAFDNKEDYVVVYVIDKKTGKYFSLDSWMQARGSASKESPFKLTKYRGNYDEQVQGFSKFLNELFKGEELRAVLEGKIWVDVRFNWGNAK